MGCEYICLGKGVMIHVDYIIELFPELKKLINGNCEDPIQELTEFVENKFKQENDNNSDYNNNDDEDDDNYYIDDDDENENKDDKFCIKCKPTGHDFFKDRSGIGSFLDKTGNAKVIKSLPKKGKKIKPSKYINTSIYSPVVFIGICRDIYPDGEYDHYVKGPEMLYSIGPMLPKLVDFYIKNKDVTMDNIEKTFGQKLCLWTFCEDCLCCG